MPLDILYPITVSRQINTGTSVLKPWALDSTYSTKEPEKQSSQGYANASYPATLPPIKSSRRERRHWTHGNREEWVYILNLLFVKMLLFSILYYPNSIRPTSNLPCCIWMVLVNRRCEWLGIWGILHDSRILLWRIALRLKRNAPWSLRCCFC